MVHELRRLIDQGRDRRAWLVGGVACSVLAAGFSALIVPITKRILEDLQRIPELHAKGVLRQHLLFFAFALPLLAFMQASVIYGSRILMASWAQRVLASLRTDLYRCFLDKPLAWIAARHASELSSRVTNDVQRVEIGLTLRLTDLCTNAPQVPIITIYLWVFSWRLALLVTVLLPIAGLLLRRWSRRIKRASRKAQEHTASLSNVLGETLHGVRVVKAYGGEAHERSRFARFNETLRRTNMRAYGTVALSAPTLDVLAALMITLVILVSAREIAAGRFDAAKVVAFFTGTTLLYQAVKKTASSVTELQNTTAAAQRCFEILDDPQHEPSGRVDAGPLREGIGFHGVSFAYGDAPVISNFDLSIRKGEVVALVGESGSGKTTLTNLVGRFYDVTAGSITWDGTDLREISPASLRRQIALVTQDTVIFDDTVAANIAYADPAPDMERVKAAARAAHADEFVRELEHGYETRLGQSGNRLSGGQRQRIAIARAVYRDAPVLVLDEATSNLDSQSESLVQDALAHLLVGRTALVVAHRLSTVQAADRIVVMSQGRVVQQGSHRELVAREGPYRQLHLLQSGAA